MKILQNLKNKLTSYLFNAVDPTRIFHFKGKEPYIGPNKIGRLEMEMLKSDAMLIRNTKLYGLLHDTLKNKAMDLAFKNSTSLDDLNTGKVMLLNIDIEDKIIHMIAEFDLDKLK